VPADSCARRTHAARGEQRGGKENTSAPIAAAAVAGRPRAYVVRALREENSIAPALIAEKRLRVSGAGWDGGQTRVGRQCDGETERVRVLR
jgi:hypothetical protein